MFTADVDSNKRSPRKAMKYDRCALNTFVLSRLNAFKYLLRRSSLISLQHKHNALNLKRDQTDDFVEVISVEI